MWISFLSTTYACNIFSPINIVRVTLEIRTDTHVDCLLFVLLLFEIYQVWNVSTNLNLPPLPPPPNMKCKC